MLAVRIAPPKPAGYDASTALGAISPAPIVLPEPTIEIPPIDLDSITVNSTDKAPPVKYKGDHASLTNDEFQALIARVKEMSLDATLLDPIRRHMLEFLTDLQVEFKDRKVTEAEAKNKKD